MAVLAIRGGSCIVDDDDYEKLAGIDWRINSSGYVVATIMPGWNGCMHRAIVGPREDQVVDHINGDKLDNRKANLRACSHAENLRNRKRNRNNRTGFKGVYFDASNGGARQPWRAEIRVDRRRVRLGRFSTPEMAHEAYCHAAAKLHGEFARTA